MRGGSWPNASVGWPVAATGPLTLRTRPGSGKLSARAGSAGSGGPPAPGRPQQGACTHSFPRQPGSTGVCAATGVEGRWRRVQDGAGAGRNGAHRDPGECCLRADCGAPGSASPARTVGRGREARGVFAGPREEPRRRALARAGGERRVPGSESGPRRFSKPPASRVSLAAGSPADTPPRSLGGRRLVATGAPDTSLRGAGSWLALSGQRSPPGPAEPRYWRQESHLPCSGLPPSSQGLSPARRQPSRPEGRVSVGRDWVVRRCISRR